MNDEIRELEELVNETLITAESYVENAIPLIEKLSEDFRSIPSTENWNELIQLFEGFAWIIETLNQIDSISELESIVNDNVIWEEYAQAVADLELVIPELKTALEAKDNPLIADLLLHAVVPSFEGMLKKLRVLRGQ